MGRPISSIGSLTSNISVFVDQCLKPWVLNLPSYTRDSIDLINKLKSAVLSIILIKTASWPHLMLPASTQTSHIVGD